ncbi:optic atrophy 3-like protein [Cercophora newfieldiana]|uniref:Optic atrophy 3-like protein n=1 Tax=Cercophora newfieldiana TaxID=92897 RepID=A0AA39YRI3_9PEZI|nr:optic atrophy 3-like protein [Cercophora newfieldiana]
MVPLPLFKLAALFVRHISKYGANRIKHQAHEHLGFRNFAAKYGQAIHQLNMRLNVALLRDPEAEQRAKEKAEAPTVKTKEQIEREEQLRAKYGTVPKESHATSHPPLSVWRRKFRPLPEAKAVDLFADVIGDAFILIVAAVLILFEYQRSATKPDHNLERIKELTTKIEDMKKKEEELEEDKKAQQVRLQAIEDALRAFKDPKTKQPLLPTPPPVAAPPVVPVAAS